MTLALSPIVPSPAPPLAPQDAHWLECLLRHRANLRAAHIQVTEAGRIWAIRDLDRQLARTDADIAYLTGEVVG